MEENHDVRKSLFIDGRFRVNAAEDRSADVSVGFSSDCDLARIHNLKRDVRSLLGESSSNILSVANRFPKVLYGICGAARICKAVCLCFGIDIHSNLRLSNYRRAQCNEDQQSQFAVRLI